MKIRSPVGVKTTSTGLSMPPVITHSIADVLMLPVAGSRGASGLARKMCEAFVVHGFVGWDSVPTGLVLVSAFSFVERVGTESQPTGRTGRS